MKKLQKALWLLLALAMIVSCVAGCAPAADPESSDSSVAESTGDVESVGGDDASVGDAEPESTPDDTASSEDVGGEDSTPAEDTSADTGKEESNSNTPATGNKPQGNGTTKVQSTTTASTKNQDNITTSKKADGKVDMGGYEFVFGTAYYTNYLNDEGVLDPTNPVIKAINKVEKDYNCKIKWYRFADVGKAGEAVVLAVQSGDKICDIAQMQYSRCRVVAYSNASHDLASIKSLDLNSGNFEKAMTEAFTFNKKVYAINFGFNANVQGLFYNADILKQYAPQYDPMKMYKDGTWTEDNFYTVLRTIATNSGNKVTPMTGSTGIMALSVAANAGGTAYKDGNKVIFGIVTPNGVKALNYVKKLYNEKLWIYPSDSSFANGTAAFIEGTAWKFKSYANISSLEFVPWPKGELGKYRVNTPDGQALCVPKTVKRKDYVGVVLNALGESSKETIDLEIQKMEDMGWSAESLAVVKWMQDNHFIDQTTGPDIEAYSEKIDNSVFQANMQPAAAMESIREAAQKTYDDYFKQFIR